MPEQLYGKVQEVRKHRGGKRVLAGIEMAAKHDGSGYCAWHHVAQYKAMVVIFPANHASATNPLSNTIDRSLWMNQGVVAGQFQHVDRRQYSATQSCRPGSALHAGLAAIVNDYLENKAPGEARYLRFYQKQPTATEAIIKATMAELPSGKRFPHQRRIPGATLRIATAALIAADLRTCRTFHELYELVQGTIGDIDGIGALTIYDTAHRV